MDRLITKFPVSLQQRIEQLPTSAVNRDIALDDFAAAERTADQWAGVMARLGGFTWSTHSRFPAGHRRPA